MAKKRIFEEISHISSSDGLTAGASYVFRVNVCNIPPDEVESYLTTIKSRFKKSPIIQDVQNLYKRTLITERVNKYKIYEPLPFLNDYFIPLR